MNDPLDFVTLSVGGQRFETTMQTLTRVSDTFFSGKSLDDKIIRIDRSPRLFEYILDYLRFGLSDMRWPDSIYTEDNIISLYHESISYKLCELTDYLLKILCVEKWCISTQYNQMFVDTEDDEKLLHHVKLAAFESPHIMIIGMHWLERNFPQSPLIKILNAERLRFITNTETHNFGGRGYGERARPDFSSLMELHRLEKSNEDLATYFMKRVIKSEKSLNDTASSTATLRDIHGQSTQPSFSVQIQEAWQRRINRVGVNHSIRTETFNGGSNNTMSDVGVSFIHCLFVSRGGSASSPWVFHFPTTTAITPSSNSSNALLTQRQIKYANTFKEVDSRRDTMQNLAPVPESEERIASLWK